VEKHVGKKAFISILVLSPRSFVDGKGLEPEESCARIKIEPGK
jgi:hypothetical protein